MACVCGGHNGQKSLLIPAAGAVIVDFVRNDLRYAVRQVRRSPGLTVIAVIALTLGIGLTTTIFSFVYGILLRALPFDEPQQIVHIDRTHLARGIKQMGVTIH